MAKRAVVVGTAFGARVHARALVAAGYDVVGLVGRDLERTTRKAQRAGIPHAYANLATALTAASPDVVAVSTPPHTHAPLVKEAFASGAHVLCEKPFTLDTAEAIELEQGAAEAGLVGLLGNEFRFVPCVALIEELIRTGAIGTPRFAVFIAHMPLVPEPNTPMPEWWFDRARGGGWLGASGSHAIDRIRSWFGEVATVSCRLSSIFDRGRDAAEDTFDLRLEMASGVDVLVQSSGSVRARGVTMTRAVGTEGSLWLDDRSGSGNVEAAVGDVWLDDGKAARIMAVPDRLQITTARPVAPEHAMPVVPFARLYEHLDRLIDDDPITDGPQPATFADGVAVMRVLDAARASSAAGGSWVSITQ